MDEQQRPENPYRSNQPTRPTQSAADPGAKPSPVPSKNSVSSILLGLCTAFGVYMTVFSLADFRYSAVYALGGVLLGLSITLGFAWPLYCRGVDRKAEAAWEKEQASDRELLAMLTEEDAEYAQALAPQPRPEPKPRKWKIVGTALAVIVLLGGGLLSAGDSEYRDNNPNAVGSTEA